MSAPVSTTETLSAGQAKDGTVGLGQVGGKNRRAAAAIPASRTLMTLQETAGYLRVTRSTIHRLLKRNQIPAFRIGRHWRFNAEEIDNWCSSGVVSKEPKADV
jgi:excisionase family DNA binding protein